MLVAPIGAAGKVVVENACTDHRENPQGIVNARPTFSWTIGSDKSALQQTGYELRVATSEDALRKGQALWSTDATTDAMGCRYDGPALASGRDYYWQVRVLTNRGRSPWSAPRHFSTPISPEQWGNARWIGMNAMTNPGENSDSLHTRLAARYLRRPFTADKAVKRAVLSISGLGTYEAFVNGHQVNDHFLAPAITFYDNLVYFNTIDVTPLVKRGSNTLGVTLGNGRYFWLARQGKPVAGFGMPRLIARLDIEYTDGSTDSVVTDGSWRVTAAGPIVANHEYDGEEYDARREMPGWSANGFDDTAWQQADLMDAPAGRLLPQPCTPMRQMDAVKPVSITRLKSGKILVDFGINMSGNVRATLSGTPGRPIVMRFSEVINPDSTLYTANLREANCTDIYTPASTGRRTFQPSFVTHGFRYMEIDGLDYLPSPSDLTAAVIYDDMPLIGHFSCSDPVINRVYANAFRGIRSNYRNIPTDCPQRDERHGWLGDRTINCWGESFIFDNQPLYAKWIADIEATQTSDGSISGVAPQYWNERTEDVTWCGAFLYSADMLYKHFGDSVTAMKHYPALKRWVDHNITAYVRDGLETRDCFGDWCIPPESPELIHSNDESRKPEKPIISTSMFPSVLQRMARFAGMAGEPADSARYMRIAAELREGLNRHYFNYEKGFYGNNAVTGNLMPLFYGHVPQGYEQKVLENITRETEERWGGHIACGLVGVGYLMRTLSRNGRADLALHIASDTTYPSWGYMAERGATTIWELWNGDTAAPDMNSYNHVMMIGDFVIWCYEDLAGIRNAEGSTAFRRVLMQPCFPDGLSSAEASYDSASGRYTSRWERNSDGHTRWEVTVPPNCSAEIRLPRRLFPAAPHKGDGIRSVSSTASDWIVDAASGSYTFGN